MEKDNIYTLFKALPEVSAQVWPHVEGVHEVFSNQCETSGLPETWITPDQLYGAISRFSVFQLFCMF